VFAGGVKVKSINHILRSQAQMILTSEQIAQYRSELANNPDALAALDIMEEYVGEKLADAAQAVAMENGIEGVMDFGGTDWFSEKLEKCRQFICQPKYQDLRQKYVPGILPPLTDFFAGSVGFPPGIAGIIATPFAIYIAEEGEKFCQYFNSLP